MFENMNDPKLAFGYWHWTLLIQPEPFPVRMIEASANYYLDHALKTNSASKDFSSIDVDTLDNYHAEFQQPARIDAKCEDYCAAFFPDRLDDEADRKIGRKIDVPLQVVLGTKGLGLDRNRTLGSWEEFSDDISLTMIESGHYIPEDHAQNCLDALLRFFSLTVVHR
ncbi:MAG: hypothetical protein M1827_003876 [Pycnora praestabilis]|nr:MAG: hypothetical protein M1827_003876 [Pycnora praestabilis]